MLSLAFTIGIEIMLIKEVLYNTVKIIYKQRPLFLKLHLHDKTASYRASSNIIEHEFNNV